MITPRHRLALLALIALAGCGGGGGGSVATPSQAVAPTAAAPAATATRISGTLSLTFPPLFSIAQKSSSSASRSAAATSRKPTYVNPTAGYVLDVYVNGTEQYNLDGVTTGDSFTITSTSDGTQTFSVPMYSQTYNDIAIVEYDTNRNLVALGENYLTQAFSPGDAPQIGVQLYMNATGIAVGPYANGQYAFSTGNYYNLCSPTTVFFFVTDPDAGLASTPGYGTTSSGYAGTVIPTATFSANDGSIATPLRGGYQIGLDSPSSFLTASITATNPANVLFTNNTLYPTFTSGVLSNLSSSVSSPITSTEYFIFCDS